MKKIHLDKIETDIDPELVSAGGDLVNEMRIQSASETEKNLWLFKIENKEVEVQTYGRKIKSFTCECSDFFETGICAHSIAAFFEIRKRKDAPKKNLKRKKVNQSSNSKKMTVSVILREAENEDLIQFISEYSKKDQQFTNALKTRFATQVNTVNLQDKYNQLLNTLIRSNRAANQTFTRLGARRVYDMVSSLLENIEDEFRGANYVEVFEAAKNIIEKITPLIPNLTAHRNDLLNTLERSYLLILQILNEPISPGLRHTIADFFTEGILLHYFNFNKLDKLFLSGLLKLVPDAGSKKRILKCLDTETSRNFQNRDIESKIFLFACAIADKLNHTVLKATLIKRVLNRSWLMKNTVDVAFKFGYFEVVKFLTDAAFNNSYQQRNFSYFDEFRFQIAVKEKASDAIAYFAAKRMLKTLNINYYTHFRAQFSDDSPELDALIRRSENLEESTEKAILLAGLYVAENKVDPLFELFEKTDNSELLKKYASSLYKFDKKRAVDLVWNSIDIFLGTHMGEPAAIKTRNFMRELHRYGAHELARAVLRRIRKKYHHRQSLKEELMSFG